MASASPFDVIPAGWDPGLCFVDSRLRGNDGRGETGRIYFVIPSKAGVQVRRFVDSRLRGNDGRGETGRTYFVIPAKAGIQLCCFVDSRLRGNDGRG